MLRSMEKNNGKLKTSSIDKDPTTTLNIRDMAPNTTHGNQEATLKKGFKMNNEFNHKFYDAVSR